MIVLHCLSPSPHPDKIWIVSMKNLLSAIMLLFRMLIYLLNVEKRRIGTTNYSDEGK